MPRIGIFLAAALCIQITVSYAKIMNPCDVADAMIRLGQKKPIVAKWVCLAKFASGFNTQALSAEYKDGSHDFGIFQDPQHSCGVPCTELVNDDITPSARCALKIFEKEGFKAWPAWRNNCQAIDTSRFIVKCSLNSSSFLLRSQIAQIIEAY
ncbi:lysozyme C [Caerostris darwini]|uniref:lysozyme n=1 Tax=Caerostris darwini TaxID=1538125 RepID=A0AAV4NST2_9ARAC|nr:lysozyme C [Caerostris darwini]